MKLSVNVSWRKIHITKITTTFYYNDPKTKQILWTRFIYLLSSSLASLELLAFKRNHTCFVSL